jgi:hypothetical protein
MVCYCNTRPANEKLDYWPGVWPFDDQSQGGQGKENDKGNLAVRHLGLRTFRKAMRIGMIRCAAAPGNPKSSSGFFACINSPLA